MWNTHLLQMYLSPLYTTLHKADYPLLEGAMKVRLAQKSDSAAVQQLLASVFDDDPLMEWFVRHDDKRSLAFSEFFDYMVNRYCFKYGECWVNDPLTGAALWMPPGRWEVPLTDQIASFRQVLTIFGIQQLLKKFSDRNTIDRNHPRHPHYYLAALAVLPAERQKGLGSRLIQPILKRCDEEGIGCYLETSRERTIRFYQRHGFSIMKKLSFSPEKLPLWCMWRTPNTQRRHTTSAERQNTP